jgi:hypothetical protein
MAAKSNSTGKGVLTNSQGGLHAVGSRVTPLGVSGGSLGLSTCEACELVYGEATKSGAPSFSGAALPKIAAPPRLLGRLINYSCLRFGQGILPGP